MHKTSQEIIGSISLWNFTNNSAELGYGIHPAYQGRGYMKETLTEVIKYGLYGLGLSYIDAYTEISNHQSIGLLEKCGFIFINTTIDKGYLNNRDYQLKCYRTQKMEN
jgi:ribosomal-protein-alanine N-acetyltransferase